MERPNILYLHSHDTGRYIRPYGFDLPTPNLQRLAERGVLFRQAFCGNPTCSPSRAVLLTGRYAHANGMLGLAHRGFGLRDPKEHIVHTLRAAGYASALCGVQHVSGEAVGGADAIGYDRILTTNAAEADARAEAFLATPPDGPFFLDCGFSETHRTFPVPGPEDDARYVRPPAPLPDTPATREDMAAYRASVRALDTRMGRVLDALDRSGLADRTLVVCTTDHGIAFPGMKCSLTDHGIGVMLLMRGPGGFTGGRVCDAMVSQVDLFPTLCAFAGIAPPPWLQGISFMPWVRGERETIREAVFAEVNAHAAMEPMRAARTARWKYIRRFDPRRRPVLPNCDAGPSKSCWIAHGWAERPLAPEALHDLVFDPNEAQNLALDPAHAGILDEMRGRLDRWMRETGDPLLSGRLPLPAGVALDPVDGLDPSPRTARRAAPGAWPFDGEDE